MMKQYKYFKIIALSLSLALGGVISYFFFSPQGVQQRVVQHGSVTIYPYQSSRDLTGVLDIFKNNWYALSARDYSLERIAWEFNTGSPNEFEPRYFGKMHIASLYDGKDFAGFITYYMKNFSDGKILYLAIGEKFRGKRYGQLLLDYAIEQLKKMGAKVATLDTRVDNVSGIKLYTRAGFTQSKEIQDGFYNFRKQIQ